ncbi:MAG: indolepyruvate ferredoxin oxidoreductase subunit alpha [Lachnospiraceae bacterium]|nr:indolepyruvate ferredoxin oxidoreductase subunit alpha [Lachnospiraceae bacterium]
MHSEFVMGNEAIGLGALAAGVKFCAGYPGTPSTEILETIAKRNPGNVYVEWSVNEKAGMEAAAGAALSGARALVTMKQVGLNVASDPLMSLEYIGVKGGMVIVVADDPGPISSQTEQDTRTFGMFSKVPVFDPSSVHEAYEMIQEAFAFSEKYHTPVFFRPTTRVDHGYESISVEEPEEYVYQEPEGFKKDASRWVIFPKLSVRAHAEIEKRNAALSDTLSSYDRNFILPETGKFRKIGIATHGVNYAYTTDAFAGGDHPRVLRVATPFPFPEKKALEFLDGLDEVLCIEELDPVIERALVFLCGKHHLSVTIRGKMSGNVKLSGENSVDEVRSYLRKFYAETGFSADDVPAEIPADDAVPPLPVRPPVLCAGCPHRASFYAVKVAMKGRKTLYAGDIGCYTLGNAHPLDMTDTCLCMGAGINMAQGVNRIEPDTRAFAFVGDSTFFASGITGTINAFYNQADITLCVLDNSTTAMTGHQPHPGTGRTIMGDIVEAVSIENVLRGIGLTTVETINPLDLDHAVEVIRRVADEPGVKAIIFRSPCIVKFRPSSGKSHVDPDKCIGCRKCIRELGCPALVMDGEKAAIDPSQCTGCTLCEQICPVGAISGGGKNE